MREIVRSFCFFENKIPELDAERHPVENVSLTLKENRTFHRASEGRGRRDHEAELRGLLI